MEMDKRDLDNLMNELNKFARGVSTIGDAVKKGIKEGIKEGNAEEKKKKTSTDDSDIAERANSRLIMRHKEEYDASKELHKSKEKNPEQEFNERTLKTQFSTNSYLEQLLKLTRENQETAKKQTNMFKKPDHDPGFLEKTSQMKYDKNPYAKFIGSTVDLGLQGKKLFSNVKEKISDIKSGSTKRQKDITKYTADINRDKALLSAEEAKLEKLKKVRGKKRDVEAIKEMDDRVNNTRNRLRSNSEIFANITAEELLHQKGKSDKNFQFKGTEKDLMKDQLSGNILHSTIKDIFPDKKTTKQPATEDTLLTKLDKLLSDIIQKSPSRPDGDISDNVASKKKSKKDDKYNVSEGLVNKPISIFETQLKDASNPSTAGEYIVGIYKELKKKPETTTKLEPTIPKDSGGVFDMFSKISKIGPLLSSLAPIAASLAAVGGGALLFNKLQNVLQSVGVGDGGAGGDTVSDLADDATLKGGKTAMNVGAKVGGKALAKTAGKTVLKSAVKKIPLVGLGAGALFAAQRAWDGDYAGAGMELASGAAGTIPGVGTAASVGIDAALLARDVYKSKKPTTPDSIISNTYTPNKDSKSDSIISNTYTPKQTTNPINIQSNDQISKKELVDTKSSVQAMGQYAGMDQMTAMTIQAKLIAMEMMAMNNSSDYINKQKDIMKTAGVSMAEKLYGGS